jgi:hypothetical protein
MSTTIIDVLLKVVDAFDKLGIPYAVGGSIASSLHGLARSTQDADVLALIKPEQARALAAELQDEFYADEQTIINAVRMRRSFNVIHLDSIYKVDIFVAREFGFEAAQLERRQQRIVKKDSQQTAFVATAEDTILAKLVWYRKGNEISDQQWRDIKGIIEAKTGILDLSYLRNWAENLGVEDLLHRAME